MPGIFGFFTADQTPQNVIRLKAMADAMNPKGRYVSGVCTFREMGVYAGWTAHASSPLAHQPFANERRDVVLILSGNCGKNRRCVDELRARGHGLRADAADWPLHLYEEVGDASLETMNGIFSGLLLDARLNCAILFNDRYGLDRVYICEQGDSVFFASEAKALLRIVPQSREFDEEGVAQALTLGGTLDWGTLFKSIRLLPGGSSWTFEHRRRTQKQYFTPAAWEMQPVLDEKEFDERLQTTLNGVVPSHFETDGNIGVSLTGGLDTRMIMACRPMSAVQATCYTFSSEHRRTLDDRVAARVAEACGLEHNVIRLDRRFFRDFATLVDDTILATDGTFGVLGAHEIFFNNEARQISPTRLTGIFGSEVLRSSSTFSRVPLSRAMWSPAFSPTCERVSRSFRQLGIHDVTFAAFREVPWSLFGPVAAARSELDFRTPFLDNAVVALAYQAPKRARQSPNSSLRLIQRYDRRLAEIPTDMGVTAGSQAAASHAMRLWYRATFKLDYVQNSGLPSALGWADPVLEWLSRRRIMFGLHKYLTYRRWFRESLSSYVMDALADKRVVESQFWRPDFVRQLGAEHVKGRRNRVFEINAVLTISAIERLLLKQRSPTSDHTASPLLAEYF